MRRRQPSSAPQNGDILPQTVQQADVMTSKRRRRKHLRRFHWSQYLRYLTKQKGAVRLAVIAFAVFVTTVVCVRIFWKLSPLRHVGTGSSRLWSLGSSESFDLVLPSTMVSRNLMLYPSDDLNTNEEKQQDEDYGGLDFKLLETDDEARIIFHDSHSEKGEVTTGSGDDDVEYYYAFDDDVERNPYIGWSDDKIQDEKHCRRTSWHRDLYLNCNSFHEFDLFDTFVEGESKYLGAGSYRQVYKSDLPSESVIFKICQWDSTGGDTFNYEDYEFMRMDMVVAEIFTSNPAFVDIYGFCGLSMFSELMPHGDLEEYAIPKFERGDDLSFLNETADVQPLNNFDPSEKLIISLQMAEAVAFLHNYERGVIVHDDIQLAQFLMTSDGKDKVFNSSDQIVRLNDFNRAEIMLFDEENKEYCRYRNGKGHGDWRAPEEYYDKPLDEKIDVWSLGCNMYSLLTGMVPFYELDTVKKTQEATKAGKKAFVDPRYRTRSYAEGKIAEAIDLCWEYEPDKRIDIGKLVKLLQEAVQENDRLMKETAR